MNSYNYKNHDDYNELIDALAKIITPDAVIVCVGTDCCIGDAYGPMVGSFLKEMNLSINVYGTLDKPICATNIVDSMKEIKEKHPYSPIIAIDSCMSENESVIRKIGVRNSGINPGKGVDKVLPYVGDYSILYFVSNVTSIIELSNIRIRYIFSSAQATARAIRKACYKNNLCSRIKYAIKEQISFNI